jgi:hypothetical protein
MKGPCGGQVSVDNLSCGKAEHELGLLYDRFCGSTFPRWRLFIFALQMFKRRTGPAKISRAKIDRNPLISLNSDEGIQGNPRKSNSLEWGFRGQTALIQEKPNDRPRRRRSRFAAAPGLVAQ